MATDRTFLAERQGPLPDFELPTNARSVILSSPFTSELNLSIPGQRCTSSESMKSLQPVFHRRISALSGAVTDSSHGPFRHRLPTSQPQRPGQAAQKNPGHQNGMAIGGRGLCQYERAPLQHKLLSQGKCLLEGRFADYCLRVLMAFFSAWTTA